MAVYPYRVYLVTLCDDIRAIRGTTLTFETLRRGFPNADIDVFDNASIEPAHGIIQAAAATNQCRFFPLERRIPHSVFLNRLLEIVRSPNQLVLIDPDLIFWDSVEAWKFDRLIAGRLIPSYLSEVSRAPVKERLHTSFLWINDVAEVHRRVQEVRRKSPSFDPFQAADAADGSGFFDTGAALYAIMRDQSQAFTEEQLNAYDHIQCGTHLGKIESQLTVETFAALKEVHRTADSGELNSLRGLWRRQEEYYVRNAVRP